MAKSFIGTTAIARVFYLVKTAIKTLQDASLTEENLIDDHDSAELKALDLTLAQNTIYKSINAKTAKRMATEIVTNATEIEKITNSIGVANGIASLDANGKIFDDVIPTSDRTLLNKIENANTANNCVVLDSSGLITSDVLPSYVDDVIEGTLVTTNQTKGEYFSGDDGVSYGSKSGCGLTPPEKGKIYVDTDTNIQYRWSGTTFTAILSSDGVELTADDIDTIWESVTV